MGTKETQMFNDFFKKQWDARPELRLRKSGLPRTFAHDLPAEMFQLANYKAYELDQNDPLWSKLQAMIYEMMAPHLTVMLALYEDGTICWLDDYADNSDFETFARREQLFRWLPNQLDRLLELLVRTKFSYISWPKLINSASDIPQLTDTLKKEIIAGSEARKQAVLDEEKRLADVADQIHPPVCRGDKENGLKLHFYVWTSILGQVVEIQCAFNPDYTFTYDTHLLVHTIGKFIVPR